MEAEMLGSLMMFPSGVLARSPSAASSSGIFCPGVRRSGKWAMRRPDTEMSLFSTYTK